MTFEEYQTLLKKVEKKKRRKILSIIFCAIGGFFLLFVFPLIGGVLVDKSLSTQQLGIMCDEFSEYYHDGFCFYIEDEGSYLHYPNGECKLLKDIDNLDNPSSIDVLSFSKDEIMISNSVKKVDGIYTEVAAFDWNFKEKRVLALIKGDYFFLSETNGLLIAKNYKRDNLKHYINVESGEVTTTNVDESLYEGVEEYGQLYTTDDGFYMCPSVNDNVFISNDNIDNELINLLKKWEFSSYRCRQIANDVLLGSFYRRVLFGQKALFIVSFNINSLELNYQMVPIFTSYQSGNTAYMIHDLFASKINWPM